MEKQDVKELARVCQEVKDMAKVVDEIKNNHLVHLKDDIQCLDKRLDKLEQKIAYYLGAASIIATLISIFFEKIFK